MVLIQLPNCVSLSLYANAIYYNIYTYIIIINIVKIVYGIKMGARQVEVNAMDIWDVIIVIMLTI